jgi:5-methylcytosine-specific restriction endonuclease McrA
MSDTEVLTIEEKKRRKAEYDRVRRIANLDKAKAMAAAYYEKNKVEIAKKAAARYLSNPDAQKETRKKWRAENRAREANNVREWQRRNPEKQKASMKKWREANRETARALTSAWAKRNRESIRVRAQVLRANNPDQYRGYVHKRRALVKGGNLSAGLGAFLMKQQRGKCACCQDKLVKYQLDHINPLSKGGEHADGNIQLLCPACNRMKCNKDPIEFMQSKGLLL